MLLRYLLVISLCAHLVCSLQVPLSGQVQQQQPVLQDEQHQKLDEPDVSMRAPSIPELVTNTSDPVANASSITGPVGPNIEQPVVAVQDAPDAIANSSQIEASPIGPAATSTLVEEPSSSSKSVTPLDVAVPVPTAPDTEIVASGGVQVDANTIAVNGTVQLETNPDAASNNTQIEANTIAENSPAKSGKTDELVEEELNSRRNSYELDYGSCGSLVPEPIMNMTIDRILNSIKGQNCSVQEFKLLPNSNRAIRDRVMEVSSMPIDWSQLTGAIHTRVKCLSKPEEFGDDKQRVRFSLELKQHLGDQQLRSRWRHYPRFDNDELPSGMFESGPKNRAQKTMSKCQRFRVESGDYYLELLSFKTSLVIQTTLTKLDATSYAAKAHLGGQVRVSNFTVDELYLDHKLYLRPSLSGKENRMISGNGKWAGQASARSGGLSLHGAFAPSVQIFHDQNNHHRRNNWLLDMYGNWLRHEYKAQLARLLGQPVVDGLNSCLLM